MTTLANTIDRMSQSNPFGLGGRPGDPGEHAGIAMAADGGMMLYSGGGFVPWHRLGTVVQGYLKSAEAIIAARLGWKVAKTAIYFDTDQGRQLAKGQFAVYRMDTGAYLGIVGARYVVFQNTEAFEYCDSLVADGLMEYETAGALGNGEKIWLLARLPQVIEINGQDVVKPYTFFSTGHDGNSSINISGVTERVICRNTFRLATNEGRKSGKMFTIKHTAKMGENLRKAHSALKQITKSVEDSATMWRQLAKTEISKESFLDLVLDVVDNTYPKKEVEVEVPAPTPVRATDGLSLLDLALDNTVTARMTVEQREERSKTAKDMLSQIIENWDKPTQTETGSAGTAWAAYNSITEFTNHSMSYNGAKGQANDGLLKAEARFESLMGGRAAAINDYAYEQVIKRFA